MRSTLLITAALVARVLAWILSALVCILCFVSATSIGLLPLVSFASSGLGPLSGILVIQTPFGGAFRGDFALAALLLFIIDWVLCKYRYTKGLY